MMHRLTRNFISYYLLLTSYCFLLFAYPPGWSDDILLTPEDMKERNDPDIAVDYFNNIWVVWDSAIWANGTGEALYTKRDSLGACLIPETDASCNASYSLIPLVAVDASNNVHIIWRNESPQGFGIGHTKLANDGSVIVPSHLAVAGAGDLYKEQMAINKYKEVNIVWDEAPSGYNQMNYTKLDSLGDTLIGRIRLSPVGVYAFWPGIGVDSFANCHLGYRLDYTSIESLAYTKVDKASNILIYNKILDAGTLPSIVADRSQNIHMVYHHPTGYAWQIRYLKLDQNGNFLVEPKTIFNGFGVVHMAIDSLQYLHAVWTSESSGVGMITYTKLDTMGNFIVQPMQIVYPPYSPNAGGPRIAVDGSNRLHVVWLDGRLSPNGDVFYKRGENETTVAEMQKLNLKKFCRIIVNPNPFTARTKISFSLSRENEKGKIEIYDVLGRFVRNLPVDKSTVAVIWDGTDNIGCELPNGVYFIRLQDGILIQSTSVILSR